MRDRSGCTNVNAVYAVDEFVEVYQLIHKWTLVLYDNISKKGELELPQSSVKL